jgi:nicotinamidase-related amidase
MDAMLVVDMQIGLRNGPPKHDLEGVVDRINRLTAMVRGRSGKVIWIQHCGGAGDDFEPNTPGWAFLPELNRQSADAVVPKTLNDPFAGTDLQAILASIAPDRVLVAGWATDLCVDATVRSAVSRDHSVVVAADAHTLSDRPHLDAPTVICHHNWVWHNLITHRSIRVASSGELLREAEGGD